MRIYDEIRSHFAQRVGIQLRTLSNSRPFTIYHVPLIHHTQDNWIIRIHNSKGNQEDVYITDILRVYTMVISRSVPTCYRDIPRKSLVHQGGLSYILAMLVTFDDIELHPTKKAAIHYVPPKT